MEENRVYADWNDTENMPNEKTKAKIIELLNNYHDVNKQAEAMVNLINIMIGESVKQSKILLNNVAMEDLDSWLVGK